MEFAVGEGMLSIEPEWIVVAGFTGRDRQDVERHLEELRREGVTTPTDVPVFYVVPSRTALQSRSVDVLHARTSGEAEIALLCIGGDIYVTLSSDHTDRLAEVQDVSLSKQLCPKVFGTTAWMFDEVAGHWDDLILRSWLEEGGSRCLYQEGTAASLVKPIELLSQLQFDWTQRAFALLCGTVPAIDGIRPSTHFWAELHDPVVDRSIGLDYGVRLLDARELP